MLQIQAKRANDNTDRRIRFEKNSKIWKDAQVYKTVLNSWLESPGQ